MYLVISEDGELSKVEVLTEDLTEQANSGLIYLVCMNSESPREYYRHEWHLIDDLPTNNKAEQQQ